jgi:hypothetical protein
MFKKSHHPEERPLGRVSKDSRGLVANPSRLAVKNGEHLRMTVGKVARRRK